QAEVEDEAGKGEEREDRGDVERPLAPGRELRGREADERRGHEKEDLHLDGEQPPDPLEEEKDRRAEGDGSEERDDPQAPGELLVRLRGVDVEPGGEPPQQLVVPRGDRPALLVGEWGDALRLQGPQLLAEGPDAID